MIIKGVFGKISLEWWHCKEGADVFELYTEAGDSFYLRPRSLTDIVPLFEGDAIHDATPPHKKMVKVTSKHKNGLCLLTAMEQLSHESAPRRYWVVLADGQCKDALDFITAGRVR